MQFKESLTRGCAEKWSYVEVRFLKPSMSFDLSSLSKAHRFFFFFEGGKGKTRKLL
jgi:hypothetical protein